MSKEELIKKIALLSKNNLKEKNVSQEQVKYVIETFSDVLADELCLYKEKIKNGTYTSADKLAIRDFGTFAISKRGARTGTDPRTGKSVEYGESYSVLFKPSKKIKDALS